MLDNIIDKNIMFFKNHGVKIENDGDKAVYKYGLQLLYYAVIDFIVIVMLAHFFGKLYETAIMMVVFALFQVFGGGHHAQTALKCLMTMIIGAAVGNILIVLISEQIVFNTAAAVIISIVILFSKPVANKKHPVGRKVKQRSEVISKIAGLLVLAAVIALGYLNKNTEVAVITVTLGLYLISSAYAKIKNKF
jgi:accessory gene regulator protein AgrB